MKQIQNAKNKMTENFDNFCRFTRWWSKNVTIKNMLPSIHVFNHLCIMFIIINSVMEFKPLDI